MRNTVSQDFWRRLFPGDRTLWVLYFALLFTSIVVTSGAAVKLVFYANTTTFSPIVKHLLFCFASVVIVVFCAHLKWSIIARHGHKVLFFIAFLMVVYSLFAGARINGAQRWVNILGISFQPSELFKLSLPFLAAAILPDTRHLTQKESLITFVILIAAPLGIIFVQSGSAGLLLIAYSWALCLIARPPLKFFWKITALGVGAGILGYILLMTLPTNVLEVVPRAATWRSRMTTHVDKPEGWETFSQEEKDSVKYTLNIKERYQPNLAKIAIARGGKTPIGTFPHRSEIRNYIPEAHNDFIYAIITEEWGLLGALFVPALYVWFFFRLGSWGRKALSDQQRLLILGLGLLYFIQAALNIAVATGFFPVTGQPLPLISSGGTSLLVTSIGFGVAIGITRTIKQEVLALESQTNQET